MASPSTAPIQVTFDHHMPEVALRELAASNRRSTKNSSRPVGALGKGHWSTTLARLRIATEALLLGANSSSAFCFCTALDRKSTRLNSSHVKISYAVFCLKQERST